MTTHRIPTDSHSRTRRSLLAGAAALLLALALPAASAYAQRSPADPIQKEFYATWMSLPGTYEAAKDGETLKLTLHASPDYRLFLELTGTRGGEKLLERGFVDLFVDSATYDKKLTVTYRPETLGKQFHCSLIGELTPGGLTGETGASDCSFPLHERVSKWKIDATPGAIVVTDEAGAVTRFTRTSR